jgi:hypothetical protein
MKFEQGFLNPMKIVLLLAHALYVLSLVPDYEAMLLRGRSIRDVP